MRTIINHNQTNDLHLFVLIIKYVVDSLLENNRLPKLIANILRLETVLLREGHVWTRIN